MDNQNIPEQENEKRWLDDILAAPEMREELGPDEHAVSSAGLTHPKDMELERIIQETKAEDWEDPIPVEEAPEEIPYEETAEPMAPAAPAWDEPEVPQVSWEEEEEAQEVYEDEEAYSDEEYEELPAADAQLDYPEEEIPASGKKIRPKRKKGYGLLGIPHILSTVIWLAIIIAIGTSLGRLVWVCAADMLAFGQEYRNATITITQEDDLDIIASKLKKEGMIRYPALFKMFVELKGGREELSSGTFVFTDDTLYDYNALVNSMSPHSSAREVVEDVMIPEGYTCAQIFALLEEKGICSAAELEEYAASGELKDYWFLEGVKRGDKYCLEGYLFPNTYDFYTNDDPRRVLEKFLNSFDDNYTDIMKDKLAPLNEKLAATLKKRGYSDEYISTKKITIREIVIIASMIEKETSGSAESYTISSVIYNRLTNPKDYPYLNIDATIIYALGGNIDPATGKTKPLTREDLKLDHPYNTYTKRGLIPGPISNPGRSSLDAALSPEDTPYYFYVYNPSSGKHIFSKNAEEHEKAVASVR